MRTSFIRLAALLASFLMLSATAMAADVGYISSSSGYMLHMSGNTAVTANWSGQSAISGFSGYGHIKMNNRCLTGRNGNQPLTWEGCNSSDTAQKWSLQNRTLRNEGGWCADVEGNRGGAGVRVMAWNCNAQASNQRWNRHNIESYKSVAARISNPTVKAKFERNAAGASAGQIVSTTTGNMVAAGGGNMVAAGGGNMVAAGGGNMVAAGGGN